MVQKHIYGLILGLTLGILSLPIFANDTLIYVNIFYPDNKSSLNNAILANISPGLPLKNNKPSLTYRLRFEFKTENNLLQLFCSEAEVDHPVVFQRFSLRDLLLPMTLTIEAKFLDKERAVDQKSFTFEVNPGKAFHSQPITSKQRITKVKFNVIKVDLGQAMLDRIAARQQLISDYYSADIQIKLAEEDLKKIDFKNPDNNSQYQEFSNRVLKLVEQIKTKKLEQNLHLQENDPLRLIPRLNALQAKALESKRELVKQSVDIHLEYYRVGMENLQKLNYSKALENFRNAIDIEPKFSAPYIRLAELELINNNPDTCNYYLLTAAYKTIVVDSVKVIAQKVFEKMIEPQLADIRLFRQQKNFDEGVILLNQSIKQCDTLNNLLNCPQSLLVERSNFYTQWLEKVISQNQTLLKQRQYHSFETDSDILYQFHTKYRDYFENRMRAEQHLSQAYQQLITTAEGLISGNPSEALEVLMLSERFCKKYSFINCNPRAPELINSVFGEIYESMVNEAFQLFRVDKIKESDSLQQKALSYVKQQNLTISARHLELIRLIKEQNYIAIISNLENNRYAGCAALKMYDSAISIRTTYNFQPHAKEQLLATRAANLCISQKINNADKRIVAKRLNEAETLLNEAQSLIQSYRLTPAPEITSKISALRALLVQERCSEQKFLLDVQLHASELHVQSKNYPAAIIALNNALKISQQSSSCGSVAHEIENSIEKIRIPAAYQTTLDEIIILIQQHDFQTAFANYINMYAQFPDSILSPFNLTILPIEKFAKKYDYTPFTLACIEILAEDGKTETALDLLYFLYEKDVPSFLTDKAQDKMGRRLAKRDIESYSKESNPKTLAYAYVRHDTKWFRKLIKSYKSQWKILI